MNETGDIERSSTSSFVGRQPELAELRAALEDAKAGRSRLLLVSGEPGIGKTRLADEFSKLAAARGAQVLWARCWEGAGAPAYWPWIQAIGALTSNDDTEQILSRLGAIASDVERASVLNQRRGRVRHLREAAAVGQTRSAVFPGAAASSTDPEEDRFQLFTSVTALLKSRAAKGSLAIVLDDLQDADKSSLLMLQFVARNLREAPIAMLVTYREAEVERSSALFSLVGELTREGRQLPLRGLNEAEIAAFVENRTGLVSNGKVVSMLHEVTAGNPLFLDGVTRMLIAEGKLAHPETLGTTDLNLPDGARNAILHQINDLSREVQSVLEVAAAAGNEFEFGLLQGVAGISAEEVLDRLDEASSAGIASRVFGSRTRYRFAHALIRATIYQALGSTERMRLHGKIAEMLEDLYSSNLDSHLAELAHHFVEAVPSPGTAEKAIDYSSRAGLAAYEVLAFEDAAAHWRKALGIVQDTDPQRRAWLLERLANRNLEKSGVDYLKEALAIYERLGKIESAGRVEVNLGHLLRGASDLSLRDLPLALTCFRKAQIALSASQNFRLLTSLYLGLSDVEWELAHADEGFEASSRAMEISEKLDNERVSANAAIAHAYSLLSRGRRTESFLLLESAWQKAERLNDAATASLAASQICYHHSLLSNPAEGQPWAQRELSRTRLAQAPSLRKELIHCLAHAYLCTGEAAATKKLAAQAGCLLVDAIVAFRYGDWDQAEKGFNEDIEVQGRRAGRPVQEFFAMLWLARLHGARGQLSQAEGLLNRALAIVDGRIVYLELDVRAELALLHVESASSKEAQPHLVRIREILASGENWAGLAGRVACAEGAAAVAEERFEDAQGQFESALRISRHYQLPWDECEALLHCGNACETNGQCGSALEKFDTALETYRRIGAGDQWIDRVAAKRSRAATRLATAVQPTPFDATFHRDGDFWTVGIGSASGRLKDLRGMHYLLHLLQHPGERTHVQELMNIVSRREVDSKSSAVINSALDGPGRGGGNDLGDAGPMLDSQALSSYKGRLDDLRSELQQAESFNDPGRVALILEEREALEEQLRSALTMRGKTRITAAHGERARSAVCKSIRFSIKRITKLDPALGRHLNESVHTGYECAYLPTDRFVWMF